MLCRLNMKNLTISIIILQNYIFICNSFNQSHAWLKCIEDICIPSDYNHLVRPLLNQTNNIQVDLRDIKILKVNDIGKNTLVRINYLVTDRVSDYGEIFGQEIMKSFDQPCLK